MSPGLFLTNAQFGRAAELLAERVVSGGAWSLDLAARLKSGTPVAHLLWERTCWLAFNWGLDREIERLEASLPGA